MLELLWSRFRGQPLAVSGLAIIAALAVIAILAPALSPYPPDQQDILNRLAPPSSDHWMGTDDLGRDVLSRVLYGARVSLAVGFVAVGIATVVGTSVGLAAGYAGGRLDTLLMRLVDIVLCFPTFFLILMVIAFLQPSLTNVMAVIGLTAWPSLARLVRGECLTIREREFVQAARGLGLSRARILLVHILPNVLGPILVTATLGVGSAVLTESALSFLGMGVQPPTPSWGNILTSGKDYLHIAWWLSVFPGLAVLVTVLAYNLLGEGLRDILDPRLET